MLNGILIGAGARTGGDSVLRRALGSRRAPAGLSVRRHRRRPCSRIRSSGCSTRARRRCVWSAHRVAFVLSHAAMYAPQAAFLSELFGTRVRYSGASLGAQLASVFAGGLAPLIATALLRAGYGGGALVALRHRHGARHDRRGRCSPPRRTATTSIIDSLGHADDESRDPGERARRAAHRRDSHSGAARRRNAGQGQRVRRVPHRPARDEGGGGVPDAGGDGPRDLRHGRGARSRRRRPARRAPRSSRRSSCRAGSARRAAPDATISATASSR